MQCKSPALLPSFWHCFSKRQMSCPGLDLKTQTQVWQPQSDHSYKFLSLEGKVPDQRKGGKFDFASKATESPVCSCARRLTRACRRFGRKQGRSGKTKYLSWTYWAQWGEKLSALCSPMQSSLGTSGLAMVVRRAHLEPPLQRAMRRERSAPGRPRRRQSALLWKRRMARRGHKGPEGEKPLHEVQLKTEVTVKCSR